MSEDMVRAVGAGSPLTVTIAGKECQVRPLGLRELAEVQRDCVDRYKRAYLETYAKNLDLLPRDQRAQRMDAKLEETARWDIRDLPNKFAYNPRRIRVTEGLTARLRDLFGEDEEDNWGSELWTQRLAATALDQGMLSEKDYRELTKSPNLPRVKVGYVNWWITGSYEGMITFAYVCFRHNGVSRNDVEEALGKRPGLLAEITRELERLSAPQAGNG